MLPTQRLVRYHICLFRAIRVVSGPVKNNVFMAKQNRKHSSSTAGRESKGSVGPVVGLRIIGGRFRGRKLQYGGDLRTRPMKDRLREAIFNLIGPSIRGKHAVDLFAGTGALALEALSRGADRATLIEQHHPTAAVIRQNIATLELQPQTEIVTANVFIWSQRHKGTAPDVSSATPWAVFCSPPYDFYVQRTDEMLQLVAGLVQSAPTDSVFVVEADARFDFQTLPDPQAWDVRSYLPAVVGIYRKE
jgi:16S rRNA (guanine966-N2)-methyltransferase